MSYEKPLVKSGIRDNLRRGTVHDFLENAIQNGSTLSVVSAYFTIYAYEKLRHSLDHIEELRFLFGDPDFVKRMDPNNKDKKAFDIKDTGLELNKQLQQKPLAKACAKWIKEKVQIRTTRQSNLLHGKMYHIANQGVEKAILGSIRNLIQQAQKAFKTWEENAAKDGKRDKSVLLDSLGADFFQLLGGISIARSRRQIQEFYTDDINEFGDFPEKLPPENCYPRTDLSGALSYKALADLIGDFALSIYRPSSYVVSETAKQRLADEKKQLRFNQADREKFLIGMMQTNFLKRLESSAHSLSETLGRTVGKIDRMLEKIDKFEQNRNIPDVHADVLPDDDDEDEEFLINRAKNPYHLRELDCKRIKPQRGGRYIETSIIQRHSPSGAKGTLEKHNEQRSNQIRISSYHNG